MSGWREIGKRPTYFPPFVNERFDGPPYWACTFAALLNGANVGFLGNKPPTHDEVRKLAVASGDPTLKRGANSSEMLRAMRVRYRKKMYLEALSPGRAHERLSTGWALVAGVTYGRDPDAVAATRQELHEGPPDHVDRLERQGNLDPRSDGREGHELDRGAHPLERDRARVVARRAALVCSGHVPHATQDQGASTRFPTGAGRSRVALGWCSGQAATHA